jgi:hypothetical protein
MRKRDPEQLKPNALRDDNNHKCPKNVSRKETRTVRYPRLLIPKTIENLSLPSGALMRIPKAEPVFRKWQSEFTGNTYGNKPLLNVEGEAMFAELVILRLFQENGWEGVWVDTFRKKYRTAWGEKGVVKLSDDKLRLLKAIYARAGSSSGCFDVFCWKGEYVMFTESKRKSKDKIRETQLHWLEAATQVGLEPNSFLIVDWSLSSSSADTSSGAFAQKERRDR